MPEIPFARYDLHLSLTGLPAGGVDEVRDCIQGALATEVPDGLVTLIGVTEHVQKADAAWIQERITPLHVLFCTLPEEGQRPDILAALSEHYHRELSCLWRSVRDGRCVQAVIELRPWRQAGTQWICEFVGYDRGAPQGQEYNWHGQNTSQWQNRETGWIGHQGAIVLDMQDRQISAHH